MNNKCFFISLLLLALSFLPLRAQDWDKVKLQTLSGDTTTPADWVDGRTPYVVSFWFVTCQHCLEEMDAITEVFEEWNARKPFRFIAVCIDDSRSLSRARALVRARGWDYFSFCFDTNRELYRAMKVTSCPYVVLFDKNGRQVYSHLGYTPGDEEALFQRIKEL